MTLDYVPGDAGYRVELTATRDGEADANKIRYQPAGPKVRVVQ